MIDHLHGVSTWAQLRAAGMGPAKIRSWVASGLLEDVRYDLYRHPAREADVRQTAAIGLLAVRGRGRVTSAAALRFEGYLVRGRQHTVDIVVPHGTDVPEDVDGVAYRRSSHLDRAPVVEREGLACVPAWWALGDLAYDLVEQAVAETLARAVGAKRITLEAVGDGIDRRGRFPGRRRLHRVLEALRSDLPFSRQEARAAAALRDALIPVEVQHEVEVGGRALLLDLALPDLQIDIEVDGPHHWLPDQAAADRVRDRDLREAGWLVLRFSVYEIERDPAAFIAEVRRAVGQRLRELGRA